MEPLGAAPAYRAPHYCTWYFSSLKCYEVPHCMKQASLIHILINAVCVLLSESSTFSPKDRNPSEISEISKGLRDSHHGIKGLICTLKGFLCMHIGNAKRYC